jgi:hypothetical protein
MLQRIAIEGIQFPRLYIAENKQDVLVAQQNGIPYIKWKFGQEELVKQLLRPVIEQMFPGIDWDKVLGKKKPVRSMVYLTNGFVSENNGTVADYNNDKMLEAQDNFDKHEHILGHDWAEPNENGEYIRSVDIADGPRDCIADNSELGYDHFIEDKLRIQDYIGDLSSSVDIDALQKLGLLPKFVGDVTDCIKRNLNQSMRWTEGYTKKLGYPLGKFDRKQELPNLVIIDVSHSIPDGIAATMLTLADTLRSQCNAELIITSRRSGYYPSGAELPKPQTLRDYYGRSNESAEFWGIIRKHIAGREFGHVISFGDDDNPGMWREYWDKFYNINAQGTKVHAVHHYHTWRSATETGYARWVKECSPNVQQFFDTSWCNVIKNKYKL